MTYCCGANNAVLLLMNDSSSNGHITMSSAFKEIRAKSENSLINGDSFKIW
jgi:predicted proteasome-type protease